MKIGIYGPGDMGRRGLNKHLGDFAPDDAKFIFAADDYFGEGTENALRWALANYEPTDTLVLYPKGDEIADDLEADSIPGEAVEGNLLTEFLSNIDVLVLLLADDDEENISAALLANDAAEAGMDVYDLTHAMSKMQVVDDTPESDAPKAPAPEPEDDPYDAFLAVLSASRAPNDVNAVLLDKAQREHVVALAENMGIEVPPGTWQKTVAGQVFDRMQPWMEQGVEAITDLYGAIEPTPEPPPAYKEASVDDAPAEAPQIAQDEPKDVPATKASPEATEPEIASEEAERPTMLAVDAASRPYVDIELDAAKVLELLGDPTKAVAYIKDVLDLVDAR